MKRNPFLPVRLTAFALAIGLIAGTASAVTTTTVKHRKKPAAKTASRVAPKVAPKAAARPAAKAVARKGVSGKVGVAASIPRRRRNVWVQTWDEPTYKDSTAGDKTEGEDPIVRQAAVE